MAASCDVATAHDVQPSSVSHAGGVPLGRATPEHCYYCFDILVAQLYGQPAPFPSFADTQSSLFVTWNKDEGAGEWVLRGCLGTFAKPMIRAGLQEFAMKSAFEDRRFSPIVVAELRALQCGVSFLVDFEEAADMYDWQLGVHGIDIEFEDDAKQRYYGTFLPEVPPAQGWTKHETIDALILKAGYKRKLTARVTQSMRVTRYQSSKCTVTYRDWEASRHGKLGGSS